MPQLTSYFERACSNVEPEDTDVANASTAHNEVRDVLEADQTLKSWGIDTASSAATTATCRSAASRT